MRRGDSIVIFKNDNSNGISSTTYVGNLAEDVDFKLADVNNDGFNDLITCSQSQGIKIFLFGETSIHTSPDYTNTGNGYSTMKSIAVADFDKDGWNDIAVATLDSIRIYLNTKQSSLFSSTASYTKRYNLDLNPLFGVNLIVADMHNEGGLSLLFSGFTAVSLESEPYPAYIEWLYRFNPVTLDDVPAPSYLFKSTEQDGDVHHPKLLLFNRGDRDFLKYKIYKKTPFTYQYYILFDSTTAGEYVDVSEDLIDYTILPEDPGFNLHYYVTAEDNSYKVSISSDTINYFTISCSICGGEEGSIPQHEVTENEISKSYSVSNYPNPFNPVTKIHYEIPNGGNVKITIYNSMGQIVKELVNEFKDAGSYNTEFNGSNFSSGIYFYTIQAGSFIQTKKMLLIK